MLNTNTQAYRQRWLAKKPLQWVPRQLAPRDSMAAQHPTQAYADRQISSGLAPYTGVWGYDQASHLLKRTTFGASRQHMSQLLGGTLSDAIEQLLYSNSPIPAPPINNYNSAELSDPTVPLGETWVNESYTDNPSLAYARLVSLKAWWFENIRYQPLHITEKMMLFWHNHFATQAGELFEPRFTYRHLSMLRQYALGNVRQMARAVTLDPQMLVYLNGVFNIATAPDENYARELQELFCIGKGSGSAYTEDDVQAAARVLTGWTLTDVETFETMFVPFLHDSNDKQFSNFYSNTLIEGQNGVAGQNELDQMLDMMFATTECAKFICRELYRFFVYHGIDAATEANVIEPLAQVLRDNNYDILPVLQTLLTSEHFFDPLNRATLIKSPVEYVVSLMREWGIDTPPPPYYNQNWLLGEAIMSYLSDLQQDLGDPPNVAGWPAYYQEPQFDKYWISNTTLPRRLALADFLLFTPPYYNDTDAVKLDPVAYALTLDNPEDPNQLINDMALQMCMYQLSPEVRQQLKSILLDNQSSDYYWTLAWNYFTDNPTNPDAYNLIAYRLIIMCRTMMHYAEYQLM